MENFEKFNKVNNSVNNASTRKSTTAKYVAGIAVATVAIALVGRWIKKKFFPSPKEEEVKVDDGFEEIKETKETKK